MDIRFVTREEAATLGLRKLPPAMAAPEPALSLPKGLAGVAKPGRGDELRVIDIRDFDLSACGGTHVRQTGRSAAFYCARWKKFARDGAWNSSPASARWRRRGAISRR